MRRVVKLGGEEVKLSPKEYELLRIMVQHAGKVLTHKFLLNQLWSTPIDPQYLRVYVRQLRDKIEPDPSPASLHSDRDRYRLSLEGPRLEPPMKISDFLSPAHVMLDVRASDKSRLLHQLSTQAAAEVGLDAAEVSKQIAKREELGSTGVGNGVALPHARLKRTQVAIRPAGSAAPRHRL